MFSSSMHPCGSVSNSELEYYISLPFVIAICSYSRDRFRSIYSKAYF